MVQSANQSKALFRTKTIKLVRENSTPSIIIITDHSRVYLEMEHQISFGIPVRHLRK